MRLPRHLECAPRSSTTSTNWCGSTAWPVTTSDRCGAARCTCCTPPDASLQADLADVDRVVLLGCLGDVPVGYAIASIHPLADGTCAADVSEVFVEPDARGVGIGNLLMHQLVHWATDRGCIGIDARALPGDRNTKNFFESFGLVARAITVHRDLRG